MIIFNFKSYPHVNGSANIGEWEEVFSQLQRNYSAKQLSQLYFAPELTSLVYWKVKFPVLNFISQTVHANLAGSGTGKVMAENLVENDIRYSLVNHSEDRELSLLDKLSDLEPVAEDLKLVVCCQNILEAKMLANLEFIHAVAYEPPELIGSGRSVAAEKPEIVKDFVEIFSDSNTIPLIGAGISTPGDYHKSLELGAKGILLASAFVKTKDKLKFIEEFLSIAEEIN